MQLLCEHGHFSLNFALHVNGTPKIYHGKLVELRIYEFYSFTLAWRGNHLVYQYSPNNISFSWISTFRKIENTAEKESIQTNVQRVFFYIYGIIQTSRLKWIRIRSSGKQTRSDHNESPDRDSNLREKKRVFIKFSWKQIETLLIRFY